MALTGSLGTFHHPGVSRIDYKPLDMDRVLTALLARLWHQGMPSKISRTATLDVDVFVKLFLEHPEVFDGFNRETTTRWTVTHLMDMVNRGRADEAVAAPRPLHGFTYRFRNSRKSRPYGADEQLYEMLCADEGALKDCASSSSPTSTGPRAPSALVRTPTWRRKRCCTWSSSRAGECGTRRTRASPALPIRRCAPNPHNCSARTSCDSCTTRTTCRAPYWWTTSRRCSPST